MNKIIASLSVFLISLFLVPALVLAKTPVMQGSERVLLGRDEIVDSDYFAAGETVTVTGTVNGDAYLAGSKVVVDGTINGDLLVGGSDLDIRGNVKGDVRAGAGNVTISGTIGGNLTVGAGKVLVTDSAVLAGSIVAGAGDLSISAPVGKGITAGVGSFTLEKKVGGDVNYWSDQELVLGPDATVSGTLTRHETPKSEKPAPAVMTGALIGGVTAASIGSLISLFVLGAVLIYFAPNYTAQMVKKMRTYSWLSLFVGFCAVILLPIFIIILFITLLGIPLAVILLLLFLIALTVAKVLAGLLVGTRFLAYFGKEKNPYLNLGVGLVLYSLLMLIPIVGWLIASGAYLIAFGGLLLYKRDFVSSLRAKKLI